MQVGLAHAACHDPDQCLVRSRIGEFDLLDREGAALLAHHGSGDFHENVSVLFVPATDDTSVWEVLGSKTRLRGGGADLTHFPFAHPAPRWDGRCDASAREFRVLI